jgi:hypothetical protein
VLGIGANDVLYRLAVPAGSDRSQSMRAVRNGVTIARSDETIEVEGNHYFPPESDGQPPPRR